MLASMCVFVRHASRTDRQALFPRSAMYRVQPLPRLTSCSGLAARSARGTTMQRQERAAPRCVPRQQWTPTYRPPARPLAERPLSPRATGPASFGNSNLDTSMMAFGIPPWCVTLQPPPPSPCVPRDGLQRCQQVACLQTRTQTLARAHRLHAHAASLLGHACVSGSTGLEARRQVFDPRRQGWLACDRPNHWPRRTPYYMANSPGQTVLAHRSPAQVLASRQSQFRRPSFLTASGRPWPAWVLDDVMYWNLAEAARCQQHAPQPAAIANTRSRTSNTTASSTNANIPSAHPCLVPLAMAASLGVDAHRSCISH